MEISAMRSRTVNTSAVLMSVFRCHVLCIWIHKVCKEMTGHNSAGIESFHSQNSMQFPTWS